MATGECYVYMTQYQLYMCCALFLTTDNTDVANVDKAAYNQWLDQAAQAFGYTSWLDFYHAYEIPNTVPETQNPPTQNLPDEVIE